MSRLLPLLLLLSACAAGEPIDITLSNVDSETRWVAGYDEPSVFVEERRGANYRGTSTSPALMCIAECSRPGMVACADIAPPGSAWAVLAGESVSFSMEGDRWVSVPSVGGECAQKTGLLGQARITVCHGAAAHVDGTPLAEPTTSGEVDASPDFVDLQDPLCQDFDVDLAASRAVTLELSR
jgi:hypothetical protein